VDHSIVFGFGGGGGGLPWFTYVTEIPLYPHTFRMTKKVKREREREEKKKKKTPAKSRNPCSRGYQALPPEK
jgi:hypothetical protein